MSARGWHEYFERKHAFIIKLKIYQLQVELRFDRVYGKARHERNNLKQAVPNNRRADLAHRLDTMVMPGRRSAMHSLYCAMEVACAVVPLRDSGTFARFGCRSVESERWGRRGLQTRVGAARRPRRRTRPRLHPLPLPPPPPRCRPLHGQRDARQKANRWDRRRTAVSTSRQTKSKTRVSIESQTGVGARSARGEVFSVAMDVCVIVV